MTLKLAVWALLLAVQALVLVGTGAGSEQKSLFPFPLTTNCYVRGKGDPAANLWKNNCDLCIRLIQQSNGIELFSFALSFFMICTIQWTMQSQYSAGYKLQPLLA